MVKKVEKSEKFTEKKISNDIIAIDVLRQEASILADQIKGLQTRVLDGFESLEIKSLVVETPEGRELKATRVQASSVVIDEISLKKNLGATLWEKVTTRSLDKAKLKAFIASGEISDVLVAKCSSEKENAPFIKITA